MRANRKPAESAAWCAVALAMCREWFSVNRPDARVWVGDGDGEYLPIDLLPAIDGALADFRAEHGITAP